MISPREIEQLRKRSFLGARAHGEGHHKAKLTDAQVAEMRGLYAEWKAMGVHKGYGELATIYGCGYATARDIVNGRTRR